MKRYILTLFIGVSLALTACSDDNKYDEQLREAQRELEKTKEDTKRLDEISKQIDETSRSIDEINKELGILDEEELTEIVSSEILTENDVLVNAALDDNRITLTIDLGESEIYDDKILLAESTFANAGDVLLEYDGWKSLAIEFVDIGNITLDRQESEINEYGMEYFPFEKVIGQLE